MKLLVVWLCSLLASACTCQSKKSGDGSTSNTGTPRVVLSQQPWYGANPSAIANTGAPNVDTSASGPAKEAGERIGKALPKDCTDQKCRFSSCNRSCADWVKEDVGGGTANKKNDQYFKCIGACMDASGDGGAR